MTSMQVTREDLNPCTVKLTVVCDPEQVKQGFDRAYKQAAKKMRFPGFRPGMAPKALVEQHIERSELNEIASDAIVGTVFKKAIEEEKLEPFSNPSVEVTKLDQDAAECEFILKVPLKPQVELGDYSAIEAEKPPVDVTDEEIEKYINDLRAKNQKREAVTDRGVQEGDVAVVNIKVDGEEGDGRTFMTIAGQTFAQLDEVLMGMQVEEMKSTELSFPDSFQEKDWAGKTHKCQVTLRSLNAVKIPELDDAFAQSLNLENIDELRTRVRDGFVRAREEAVQNFINEQLIDTIVQKSKICVPDNMWEQVAAQRLRDLQRELHEEKRTLEQYTAENGKTVEEFVDAIKNEARTFVHRAQIIQEIFIAEKMEVSISDLNLSLAIMAHENDMKPEDLYNLLKKNNAVREIHNHVINRKVMELLNNNAKFHEPS